MKESSRSGGVVVNQIWEHQFKNERLFQSVTELGADAQLALYLRFWENYDIEEISNQFRITWDQANALIESSLKYLREKMAASHSEAAA